MKRKLALLCAVGMPFTFAFAVPAWDQTSLEAAETFLRVNADGAAPDIHHAEQFPDGARGFYVESLPPLRTLTPNPAMPDKDQMLAQTFCSADVIVLARAGDSVSALTRRNTSILTRTEFETIDVVKSRSGLQAGQRLSVVRLGGEVIDQGVTLRVVDERGDPYRQGQTYFLVLVRPRDSASQDFFMRDDPVPVRAGRIAPGSGRWETFAAGETYTSMKQHIVRVSRRKPCAE